MDSASLSKENENKQFGLRKSVENFDFRTGSL